MQTAQTARFESFARYTSNIDSVDTNPFNNEPSFSPCAHDSRAFDQCGFESDSFDCFSLSIDTLI
jgi:hypothetical protein